MPTLIEQYQADLDYLNVKRADLVAAREAKLAERSGLAIEAADRIPQLLPTNYTNGQQHPIGQDAVAIVNAQMAIMQENESANENRRKLNQLSARESHLNNILFALPSDEAISIDFTKLSAQLECHIDMQRLFNILEIKAVNVEQYIKQSKPKALRQELILKCRALINAIHEDIKAIYNKPNSLTKLVALKKELVARQGQIDTEIEAINRELTEFDTFIAAYQATIAAEPARIAALEALEAQCLEAVTQARKDLINSLINKLEQYQLLRNAHYQLKDKVTPKDKENRDIFIQDLVLGLDAYHQNGSDDAKLAVLTLIDTNMGNFPGVKLNVLLNKIKFELLSFGLPVTVIPVDYIGVSSIPAHYNEPLKSAIVKLYQQLNSMFIYGNTSRDEKVILLERDLKNDLDRFVIENTAVTPTAEIFDAFKARFTARLHSHDDVLSQRHDGQWKPIVANILIALATVGLALVIKAAHSKLTTGRMTGFFSETERQRQADAIEKSVNDIPAPAAMAAA